MTGHETLAEYSALLWPAMASHLWQATIVAGLCLLALPAFRSAGAKARHGLWALAFVCFAIPQDLVSFIAGPLGIRAGFDNSVGAQLQQVSGTVALVARPPIIAHPQTASLSAATGGHRELYCMLTIVWIAGCVFLLTWWWFRQYRFAGSLRKAGHEAGTVLIRTLESLKRRLGVRRQIRLRIVGPGHEPGVCGIWRPLIVLPEEMPKKLTPAEIEAVLAHELVHVARWDNLWSSLQMIVCGVFWFYPVIWLLDRRLIAERERFSDERVIGILRNPQAFASGLVKIMGIGLGLRIAGISPIAGANLKGRIENIMSTNPNRNTGWAARLLLYSIAAFAFVAYLLAVPFHKDTAQLAPVLIKIENSQSSPLEIVSASAFDISVPQQRIRDVTTHIVKPKIEVKNNSDRIVSVYVLEFRKSNAAQFYLTRNDLSLPPKGTDSFAANASNAFLYPADTKTTGTVGAWAVRVDVVRFRDGEVVTLHPSPIPPPEGSAKLMPKLSPAQPVAPR